MKRHKEKVVKFVWIIGISLLVGIIAAVSYAGYCYLRGGENKGKCQLDDKYIKASHNIKFKNGKYEIMPKGGKLVIELPKQYINKLTFEYSCEYFSGCTIEIEKENIYGLMETQSIDDKFMEIMPRSVVNIGGKVNKINFTFEESYNPLQIWNFVIDNSFKVNPLIALFVASIVFLVSFLIIFRKENAENPALSTFVIIIVSSICLLLIEPPYIVGWDEQIHYKNAYMLGVTKKDEPISQVEEYLYVYANVINVFSKDAQESIEERLDIIRVFDSKKDNPALFLDNYELGLNSSGYVFQALALRIGNMFHLPFYLTWLLGKFTNILLYSVLMGLSVYIVPIGKRLLMVFAMLPTMIFQSTTYTYDVTVIAFLTLAITILIREFVISDRKFRYRFRILFWVSSIVGCLPKAVYAPLILGGIFVEKDKFYSDKDRRIFRFLTVLEFIAMMMTFVLPTLISPNQAGDDRGGDTSEAGQLQYVLGQPLAYAVILVKSVIRVIEPYLIGKNSICSMAYLGVAYFSVFIALLLVVVILTDVYVDRNVTRKVLSIKQKSIILFLILMVIVLVYTALYLSFTEVGLTEIRGVQGRYYLPFLFLFYLCFQTDKIQVSFSKVNYQCVISLVSVALLFQQFGQRILIEKCL